MLLIYDLFHSRPDRIITMIKKLVDIHFRFCWYKICEDLLRNRKVIVENKVTHLYRSLCIILLLKGVTL